MKLKDAQIVEEQFITPKITVPIKDIDLIYIRISYLGNIKLKITSLFLIVLSLSVLTALILKGEAHTNVLTYVFILILMGGLYGLFIMKYHKIVIILKGLTYRYDVFYGSSDDVLTVYANLYGEMTKLKIS